MIPHETTRFVETEWIPVPILSVVCAGKSNMEDLPIQGWRRVRASSTARSSDTLCCAPVQGDSLAGDGISDGDYVVVRLNFDVAEVTPGRLAAVWTPSGLLIKHVYVTLDDQVRLVSSNPRYTDLIFDGPDVEIQGLIVRVERDM